MTINSRVLAHWGKLLTVISKQNRTRMTIHTKILFWKVTPRIVRGWKRLGTSLDKAVPDAVSW